MEKWRELAGAVERAGVPLPRGVSRFVIERRPAAAIIGDRRRVLVPAKWQIPSTQTRPRTSQTEVRAQVDAEDVLSRLAAPAGMLELPGRAQ